MSNLWKTATLALLLFSVLSVVAGQEEGGQDLKVGGWQEIPVAKQSSYEEALHFILKEASELTGYRNLLKVERKVVAGIIYRFTLQTEFGVVEAIAYKDLNGQYDLMSVRPSKSEL